MMNTYRRIVLAERPRGEITSQCFRLETVPVPDLKPGQILVKNHFLSLDPYMRGRMSERKSYANPQALNETMIGGTVGEVIASENPQWQIGDRVAGMFGWSELGVSDGQGLRRTSKDIPMSAYLGVLGMPGMTAWYGVHQILKPVAGKTVVISSASGAVGGTAGSWPESLVAVWLVLQAGRKNVLMLNKRSGLMFVSITSRLTGKMRWQMQRRMVSTLCLKTWAEIYLMRALHA